MKRVVLTRKTVTMIASILLAVGLIVPVMAGSTTKNLSSNFTLVNLGNANASGQIEYLKPDGTPWKTPADQFNNLPPGGQLIYRQYEASSGLSAGRGSVIVSADQPLGAVVQLQARDGQVPSSGAYSGVAAPSDKVYVPLVMRRLSTASGLGNSQIIIQNTTPSQSCNVSVDLIKSDGTTTYTKTFTGIAGGASEEYDLDDETNLPENWFGSAVVRATASGCTVGVVSNLFSGPHALQTFNGFATPAQKWFAPLVTSRLSNGLSTPVAVQNLSGGTIPVNGVTLNCKKDAASPGSDFSVKNSTAIGNTASYFFNPVVDTTNFPTGWFGSCSLDTTGYDTVAFVQMRVIGQDNAASYEAIPGNSTAKKSIIPLAAKQLANGFATAVTIQNLSTTAAANVELKYIPSPDCPSGAGQPCAGGTITISGQTIPAGGSLIQNHRTNDGVPQLPAGWFGSLVVTSSDQPIDSFVQLTIIGATTGDTFQAHNGFTSTTP
ncbi:MAG TPA: hypothetical protein ENJ35_03790 [Gammaproteobacteria bacterium]|nr:hypothetical protein [Gammaproteobacteria bacterium]